MSAVSTNDFHQRLSEQLQALSQVGETLTLRLLEMEERLGCLEEHVQDLQRHDAQRVEASGSTTDLLMDTEARIARLEDLLSAESISSSSHSSGQAVPLRRPTHPSIEALHDEGSPLGEPHDELNPFPEEEEQSFMDELSA